jgi:hypothetical protein
MFLIAMFIVYFGYLSSIVSLLLSSCIYSYSTHPNVQDPWVGGRHYVSVVLRLCVELVEPSLERGEDYVSDPP